MSQVRAGAGVAAPPGAVSAGTGKGLVCRSESLFVVVCNVFNLFLFLYFELSTGPWCHKMCCLMIHKKYPNLFELGSQSQEDAIAQ